MWVQSLHLEDSLEEGLATHSSILAWRMPQTEEPCGRWSTKFKESDVTEVTEHARTVLRPIELCYKAGDEEYSISVM